MGVFLFLVSLLSFLFLRISMLKQETDFYFEISGDSREVKSR